MTALGLSAFLSKSYKNISKISVKSPPYNGYIYYSLNILYLTIVILVAQDIVYLTEDRAHLMLFHGGIYVYQGSLMLTPPYRPSKNYQ